MTSDAIPEDHSDEAQIAAEIADHLAAAAAELQQQGLSPGVAQTAALSKFGDIRTIEKQCYWAKNGETMMFRWGMIALLSVLVLFVGITALGSWRTQTHLTAQIDKLTEQLGNLAKTQQAAQQQVPLEIAGQVFEGGDRFKRQSGVSVEIINTTDGKVVFRQSTDSFGEYSSGRLPEGEYSVICRRKNKFLEIVQSAPISLYPGVGKVLVDVDIADLPTAGPIKFSLSNPLPSKRVEGKYQLHSALYIKTGSARNRNAIWTKQNLLPNSWPLYCRDTDTKRNCEQWVGFHYSMRSEDIAAIGPDGLLTLPVSQTAECTSYETLPLPAGDSLLAAYIFTDIELLPESESNIDPDKGYKTLGILPPNVKNFPLDFSANYSFFIGHNWLNSKGVYNACR